jgi:hypothetical protein
MIWPWIVGGLAASLVASSWLALVGIYCWMRWRKAAQHGHIQDLMEGLDAEQATLPATDPVAPPAGVSRPTRTGAAPTHPVGGSHLRTVRPTTP